VTPQRLQLSRKKGFRLPLNAKSVARPHRWGNPFEVWKNREWYADTYDESGRHMGFAVKCEDNRTARYIATMAYATAIGDGWRGCQLPTKEQIRAELAGLSLACWCPLPEPGEIDWCHARILIELANA
jgi:hypothetical protein